MSPKILFLSVPAVSLFLFSLLAPGTPSRQSQEKAELAKQAYSILKTKCFSCHGQNGVANKNVFVLDLARMLKDKTVIPGDASCSLIKQVESGAMPLGGDKLPASEIDALKKWVVANAPDWARPCFCSVFRSAPCNSIRSCAKTGSGSAFRPLASSPGCSSSGSRSATLYGRLSP